MVVKIHLSGVLWNRASLARLNELTLSRHYIRDFLSTSEIKL